MALDLLMLIRHAERPAGTNNLGVAEDGSRCPHSLTVTGWQRAGALVALFRWPALVAPALATPACLYACPPTPQAPSRRSVQTLGPLSRALGRPIDTRFEKQREDHLAAQLHTSCGNALVAWSHRGLPALAQAYLHDSPAAAQVPLTWPEDRFDLVWIIDGPAGQRRLRAVDQNLLAGDVVPAGDVPSGARFQQPREP